MAITPGFGMNIFQSLRWVFWGGNWLEAPCEYCGLSHDLENWNWDLKDWEFGDLKGSIRFWRFLKHFKVFWSILKYFKAFWRFLKWVENLLLISSVLGHFIPVFPATQSSWSSKHHTISEHLPKSKIASTKKSIQKNNHSNSICKVRFPRNKGTRKNSFFKDG